MGSDSLNPKKNMIIANDKIITPDVVCCNYNSYTHKYDVQFKNGKTYHYNYTSVKWLREPQMLDPNKYHLSRENCNFFDVVQIYLFESEYSYYFHVCFRNGTERDYFGSEITVKVSCLNDDTSKNVFDYLKHTATLTSIHSDDGTNLLLKQYEKIDFIDEQKALALYLNPSKFKSEKYRTSIPIFPFGCNSSQYSAVINALENQISVIEGPPGTGKTQTILNIAANLIVQGKTVQIVSNNNSATENILEKLSSPKYNMGFIVAMLGNSQNKAEFIKNQTAAYPDIRDWSERTLDTDLFYQTIREQSEKLKIVFDMQEQIAVLKQIKQDLMTEQKHFEEYISNTNSRIISIKAIKNMNSSKILELWHLFQGIADKGKKTSFFLRLKLFFLFGIADRSFYTYGITEIIISLQKIYYILKIEEVNEEISRLESELLKYDSDRLSQDFCNISMIYLKNVLYNKYAGRTSRPVFTSEDFYKRPSYIQDEYPVILSTTFSSRSSLCKEAEFDYIIMDEASQVDVATGALALSCAKNAVIVGDNMQLPNVVPDNLKEQADSIFSRYSISDSYNFANNSLLKSICRLLPDVPKTLLKEHYRCHPKIINYCNQKFYGGQLVIMTEDKAETDVISVVKTVEGNHDRQHVNQRQIDVICKEVLPNINTSSEQIGIIAPYNNQVNALRSAVSDSLIDIATVHKFQGREKDTIIITTVDNEVTEFSDDPNLLNVAVSRAKKKLCLVVSGNKQRADSNIGDLISYIEYNNFSVTESKLYSVFDYLYKQYTESRFDYLKRYKKVSEYDSENLMYVLIRDILGELNYTDLDIVCHQPLNLLIKDYSLLNEDEYLYATNPATHLDFLIYSRITKKALLAIEVDGYRYHKEGTAQKERDKKKNRILELYNIPYLRFATNGSGEKEVLIEKLNGLYGVNDRL